MTSSTLFYFLGASLALTLAPGPDNTFVIAQGIARGKKAAIFTAWGMCSGISVHTTAAALGISAILYSSATAFTILKYAGAAYLLFLACRAVKENSALAPQQAAGSQSGWVQFRRGFVMNVVNPKVGLFFLAFLPQFVSRSSGGVPAQMVLLGLIFMLQAAIVFSVIGFLAGSIGNAILKRSWVSRYGSWVTAAVLASLGLRLIFARK